MLPSAPSLPAQLKEGGTPDSVSRWSPSKGLVPQTREAESEVVPHPSAPTEVTVEEPQQPLVAEEETGVLAPTSGLLQVTERRQPLSSVSSLEVHFDLLDLTELTDMSDQELAEVFADSDDENPHNEPPPGLQLPPLPRAGYLRSPSWTRSRAEREKKHLSDSELQGGLLDTFLSAERSKEN
ncbi:dysbindin domain-containing protein 1 isoform X1 [Dendropsophus ebraccatus]|uniref:dysbindin domain-containing protein 1 isoform X1 n=1 Tax=Dendropsophus ebraccatus TaxID=150705 RepID=UPI003831C48D